MLSAYQRIDWTDEDGNVEGSSSDVDIRGSFSSGPGLSDAEVR